MIRHLKTKLKLARAGHEVYDATVTIQTTDSCYRHSALRPGLPHGMVGIPEEVYLTAEFTHQGEICAQIVQDVILNHEGIRSSGKTGVTIFVTVNDELAGSASEGFPEG